MTDVRGRRPLAPRTSADAGDGGAGGGVGGDGGGVALDGGPMPDWLAWLLRPGGDGGALGGGARPDAGGRIPAPPSGDIGYAPGRAPGDTGATALPRPTDAYFQAGKPGSDGGIFVPGHLNPDGTVTPVRPGSDSGYPAGHPTPEPIVAIKNISPDAGWPLYLTIDAAGNVGAAFSGKISAQGVDLPAWVAPGPTDTPNKVRWLRQSDGTELAYLTAGDDGTANLIAHESGTDASLEIEALRDDVVTTHREAAINVKTTDGSGRSEISGRVTDDSGTVKVLHLLRSDGASRFMQFASVIAFGEHKVNMGRVTLTFPGGDSRSNVANVAHTLGVTPLVVLALPRLTSSGNYCYMMEDSAPDATNIHIRTRETGGVALANTVTQVVNWLAIS